MSDEANGDPIVHRHDMPTVPVGADGAPTQWLPPTESSSVVLPSASVPKRSRSGRIVGAGVGAVAVLLAGGFAVRAVTSDGGGYDTPSAAVEALLTSIGDEDVIGAMDAVLPGEQAAFREPFVDMMSELRRLEVLSDDADESQIAGIDIRFDDLAFEEETTDVDDITNVAVTGEVHAEVDGSAVPLGDMLTEALGDNTPSETMSEDTDLDGLVLTTVKKGDSWYVGLMYTVAEQARQQADEAGVPSKEAAVQPRGGESPEDGMDVMLDAIEDLDLEKMIGALDPHEFEALQRYAPLFIDDAQRAADDVGMRISIDDREYAVDSSSSTAHITLSAATVSLSMDGEEVELAYEDGCVSVSGSSIETQRVCEDDVQSGTDSSTFEEMGLPTEEFTALGESITSALSDFEGGGITMTKVDGEWFVSPIGTMSDTMLSFMRALDRDEIEDIADSASNAFSAFTESFTGSIDDPFGTQDSFDDEAAPDSFSAYYECVAIGDAVERAQCLQDGIDSGAIEDYYVTPQEIYPECGLAEFYENGYPDYGSLTDDDFVSLFADAQSCFQGLIDAGALDTGMPLQLVDLGCYEGRNPDAIEDIDERFDFQGEVYDCLLAAD